MKHRATTRRLWHLWHDRDVPWWQALIVGTLFGVLVLSLLAGLVTLASRAGATEPAPATTSQRMGTPKDAAEFTTRFQAGDYSRAHKTLPYSRPFKRAFLHLIARYGANHPQWEPCPGTGNLGCTWTGYTARDTCAVSSLPDTFDADSCRETHGLRSLLASPYWKRRSATYNKWTLRIVVCGTIALTAIAFKASPKVAIGSGSTGCLANRLVP